MRLRAVICSVLAVAMFTAAPSTVRATGPEDPGVASMVAEIFDGKLDSEHDNVVLDDVGEKKFWAFHVSRYLDVLELRVYMIPHASADAARVRQLLDEDDDDAAFESLLANMNLSLGAMYLADVGLDGIRDEDVAIGEGSMRDSFHRQQFADHAEADAVYREWLARALTVRSRAS